MIDFNLYLDSMQNLSYWIDLKIGIEWNKLPAIYTAIYKLFR